MLKRLLLSGMMLIVLTACGWLNLPQLGSPGPGVTTEATPVNSTALPQPTATLRTPSRNTPTPETAQPSETQATPAEENQPVAAPEIEQSEEPLYVVQPGTPTRVTNFLVPEAGCSYMGIAGQVFDLNGSPVQGLIIEVSGKLEGNDVLQLVLTGSSTKIGPGGYEIRLADRAIASKGTLFIQIFDLAGKALSQAIPFDTYAECDSNQLLLNFTATKIEYDDILYFPYIPND